MKKKLILFESLMIYLLSINIVSSNHHISFIENNSISQTLIRNNENINLH